MSALPLAKKNFTTPASTVIDAPSAVAIGAIGAGAVAAAGAAPYVAGLPPSAGTGSSGTINSATMLMILISGLTAGPAVSL